jgi:hypothetical protein
MSCADARHRILTADLAALRGESDASLREHLAGCATCTLEASRVVSDTSRLRAALVARQRTPQPRRSRERRIATAVIPIALAAEITLIAVLTQRAAPESFHSPMLDSSITSPAPAVSVPDRQLTAVSPPVPVAVRGAAVAESTRRTARRPDTTSDDPTLSQVRVTVSESQRAAIIATSNPKVTLVWLSKGDSL